MTHCRNLNLIFNVLEGFFFFFNIFKHSGENWAHLSRQEVDLCDSSGVIVQTCELHTRRPIAAGIPLKKYTTWHSDI